jgi:hypothetical protein
MARLWNVKGQKYITKLFWFKKLCFLRDMMPSSAHNPPYESPFCFKASLKLIIVVNQAFEVAFSSILDEYVQGWFN